MTTLPLFSREAQRSAPGPFDATDTLAAAQSNTRPLRSASWLNIIAMVLICFAFPTVALGQGDPAPLDPTNPFSLLDNASRGLPLSPTNPDSPVAELRETGLSTTLSIVLLLTVLSLAPALLVMCTSFTRIVVVLALLKQALGTQSLPPSQVITGLALFMTLMVMAPTFDKINAEALQPLQAGEIGQLEAWDRAKEPVREFMFAQIEHAGNWDSVEMLLDYRQVPPDENGVWYRDQVDMLTLVPAFVLSELKVAFLMGFRIYLPFLIIDMVIASVLISMGMLMLPPVLISLPFKLLLFVLVDGWALVAGNLLHSFATTPFP